MEKSTSTNDPVGQRGQELYTLQKYYEYVQHIKSVCKRKMGGKDFDGFHATFNAAIKQLTAAHQVSFYHMKQ